MLLPGPPSPRSRRWIGTRGYWQQNPLAGHPVDAFAQIDPTNTGLIQQCIAYFGAIYTGFDVPESAQEQFDAGRAWTVVPSSPIGGRHCVPILGFDPTYWYCLSWGSVQALTNDFVNEYFLPEQELWVDPAQPLPKQAPEAGWQL